MFKKIKFFITELFYIFKNWFLRVFQNLRIVRPKQIFVFIATSILLSSTFVFSSIAFASLPGNRPDSLVNYISSLEKSDLVGYSFAKTTYSGLGRKANYDSEDIKKVRDVYRDSVIFEVYSRTPEAMNDYPAIVNYIDNSSVNISFALLQQQHSYYGDPSNFVYPIPFITGSVKSNAPANTVYINKEYADKLLIDLSVNTYDELIGKLIEINDSRSYKGLYIVSGILDSASKEYLQIKSYLGDFFVLPEYFGMERSSMLYFELSNDFSKDLDLIRFIDKTFIYDSIFSSNGGFVHEYRTSFFSIVEGWGGATYEASLKYINSVYDYYFYQGYIFGILQYLALGIGTLVASLFMLKKFFVFEISKKAKFVRLTGLLLIASAISSLVIWLIKKIPVVDYGYLYLNFWPIGFICVGIFVVVLALGFVFIKKSTN